MRIIASLFFFTLSLFASIFGQQAEINGFASLAKDSKVYAFEVSDGLTNQLSLLTQTSGDSNGHFNLKIPLKQTKSLVICTGNARTRIWVDPNQQYKLTFLNPDTTITQNGFVQFWESRIESNSPSTTNALIGLINNRIAEFISNNTYEYLLLKSNTSKASIQRIREKNPTSDIVKFSDAQDSTNKAESKFNESLLAFETTIKEELKEVIEQNSFVENYLFCKIGHLKTLTGGSDSYEEMSKRIDLTNPAFCEWVELFSRNYLDPKLIKVEKQKFDTLLQKGEELEEIIKFLNLENSFNLELEEVIFASALRTKYYSHEWSEAFVSRLNQVVSASSKNPTAKQLIQNFEKEIKEKSQRDLRDFTLYDDSGEAWVFSKQCDRNMYLYFFNSSKTSQRDLALLNQLASKYKNDFSIIAIGMQHSYDEYSKALQSLKLSNLTTIYGGNDYKLIDDLRIQTVPFAIETNNKGKISFNYTPLPSEGIQVKWEEILRKNKK